MKLYRPVHPALLCLFLFAPSSASADTASRLFHLLSIPGVSGYEQAVREAIELSLPPGARVRADNMGNIILRVSSGTPHTLVVAPLDEGGLVVSGITPDGYLRAHRHTSAPGPRLSTQYLIGQPVEIRTATGQIVPGVTATASTHLRGFRDAPDEARIKGLDDVWIDIGAESAAAVERAGVRMLDSLTLRERAVRLANGRIAGVGAGGRAAALALAEVVRGARGRPQGGVTIAWVVQSAFGQRGTLRVMETVAPDRVIVLRGSVAPGDDPAGGIGMLGGGPVLPGDRSFLSDVAARDGISTQGVPPALMMGQMPAALRGDAIHVAMVPALFAQTPVETVDARDIDALAQLVASAVGFGTLGPAPDQPGPPDLPDQAPPSPAGFDQASARQAPPSPAGFDQASARQAYETLRALIETPGVSGHEGPVREQILKRLPAWAKPEVDSKGNIRVSAGPAAGKAIVFVAHMDEVGFEIAALGADGRATLRTRGGMYLSLYEAHPVLVHTPKGPVAAVLAPRRGYTTAKAAQPDLAELSLYFGTDTADATRALGIAEGQSVTVRKKFVPLGAQRATGRAMDDRNGSTALLLALQKIDPAKLTSRVTFAWAVQEETGLAGAAFMATEIKPHTAFAIDTFVTSDTPVDSPRGAAAKLGQGAVLRGMDGVTLVQAPIVDRIAGIAKAGKIPLQIGVTGGGTDASVFSKGGAIDVGLSWPGRYSHSPVEVMDRRDLAALVNLIAALALEY